MCKLSIKHPNTRHTVRALSFIIPSPYLPPVIPLPGGLGDAILDSIGFPASQGSEVAAGFVMTIPLSAPAGFYEVRLVTADQDGRVAYCMDAQFEL